MSAKSPARPLDRASEPNGPRSTRPKNLQANAHANQVYVVNVNGAHPSAVTYTYPTKHAVPRREEEPHDHPPPGPFAGNNS
jgi:hypothetical protein